MRWAIDSPQDAYFGVPAVCSRGCGVVDEPSERRIIDRVPDGEYNVAGVEMAVADLTGVECEYIRGWGMEGGEGGRRQSDDHEARVYSALVRAHTQAARIHSFDAFRWRKKKPGSTQRCIWTN